MVQSYHALPNLSVIYTSMTDVIGKVYNRLTIIKQDGCYNNGRKVFLCQCVCGGLARTSIAHLKRGDVKSCGCLVRETSSRIGKLTKVNMAGVRIGRLNVLKEGGRTKNGSVKWLCRCDCGTIKEISGVNLRRGYTKSCGCMAIEKIKIRNGKRRSKNPWIVDWNVYLAVAKKRSIDVLITFEQFLEIVQLNCFYCGIEPSGKCHATELKEENIHKNGIDRKNSKGAYSLDNCVACCAACNIAKYTFSIKEFASTTKRRFNHLKSRGIIQ